MSNLFALPGQASDVALPGPLASTEYGIGATYYYPGNRAAAINPQILVGKFQTIFQYADEYRRNFLPEWLEAFGQYNGELVADGKEPWQSDIHIPLPAQAIDIASGRIIEAIFNDDDFFEVDPDRESDTLLTEFAQKAVKWQIKKSRGMHEIKTSMKDALICGFGPLKVHFELSMEPFTDTEWVSSPIALPGEVISSIGEWEFVDAIKSIRKMKFESVIPTDIWLDPTGKNRYIIQRSTRSVSDLWPLTENLVDPDTGKLLRKKVYDPKAVARVVPGMRDPQRDMESARIRRDSSAPYGITFDQTVDVYELWGDFIDPDTGVTLFKNSVTTFVDKRICIRPPQRNPFRHGRPPFIVFQSKLLPHQVYGYGLLHQNRRIEDSINRQANVILDKAMLQVPTLEYDGSASKDPAIQGGSRPKFSPGKMWPRKPGPDKRIFYPVEGFQPIQPMDLAIMDRLTNWYQMSSTVPEFEGGQSLNASRKTKGEVELRMQAAQQNFNDAAVHIQEQGIGPMLKMIYLTMLQYEDQYDDDTLSRMYGDDQYAIQFIGGLRTMSPAERWRTLFLDGEFKAVGVTNAQTRARQLQQTGDFVRVVSADPLLSMFVNKREQLKDMLHLFQQPKRMVLDNSDAMIQQAQMGVIMQSFGMMGPPGQGGAPGAPPQLGPAGAPPGASPMGKKPQGANPHNSLASVAGEAGRTS